MLLPITLTIGAAAAFIHFWLVFRCAQVRIGEGIMVGDGGNTGLTARMRAHANFTENVPLFLILLALNELGRGASNWLWGVGIAVLLARLAHPIGMDRPSPNIFRAAGMLVTTLGLLALAVSAILLAYEAGQPVMIG